MQQTEIEWLCLLQQASKQPDASVTSPTMSGTQESKVRVSSDDADPNLGLVLLKRQRSLGKKEFAHLHPREWSIALSGGGIRSAGGRSYALI